MAASLDVLQAAEASLARASLDNSSTDPYADEDRIERDLETLPSKAKGPALAALAAAVKASRASFDVDAAAFVGLVVDGGLRCVDVRSPGEFARGHVPGAVNVPLFDDDPKSHYLMERHIFFAVLNFMIFLGDTASRKLAYHVRMRPGAAGQLRLLVAFLACALVGLACIVGKQGLFVIIGGFLVFFANGSIYATTTRFVDFKLSRSFHLAALSFWLFVGDVGSVLGSNLVMVIKGAVCPDGPEYHMVCRKDLRTGLTMPGGFGGGAASGGDGAILSF